MSTVEERALRKAIRDRSFERVYYFHGDDDFLKEGTARELIAAVLDPSTRDFNHEVIRGDETTAEALETAVSTPPMFADRRMVVVRDVHALKKDARAVLDAYLTHPAADTVLLLVDPAGEDMDKELAGRSFVVDFAELSDNRMPGWIAHHATTTLGVTITEPAAQLLHEAVGLELAAGTWPAWRRSSTSSRATPPAARSTRMRCARWSACGAARPWPTCSTRWRDRNAARAVALVPVILSQPNANAVTDDHGAGHADVGDRVGQGGAGPRRSAGRRLERLLCAAEGGKGVPGTQMG